jgi:hypothetical protein
MNSHVQPLGLEEFLHCRLCRIHYEISGVNKQRLQKAGAILKIVESELSTHQLIHCLED